MPTGGRIVSRLAAGRTWRAVLAGLVLVACQDAEPDWEAFAISQYVDATVGDAGRDEHGWVMVEGRRGEESLVLDTAYVLPDRTLESVRRTVQAMADSAGIGPVVGEGFKTATRAWRGSQGVLVTVSASNPTARTATLQIFDEELGRLVAVPAYRNFVEAVFWIADATVVLRAEVHVDQDIEVYAGPSWLPHDIVDVEGDGTPEIVLLEMGYESRHLIIFSIVDELGVLRWEGLGSGL